MRDDETPGKRADFHLDEIVASVSGLAEVLFKLGRFCGWPGETDGDVRCEFAGGRGTSEKV